MAKNDSEPTPTQPTQPKGRDKDGKPYEPVEIPVPKVSMIRAAIRKLAQPDKSPGK
jgi:hypothetical protein